MDVSSNVDDEPIGRSLGLAFPLNGLAREIRVAPYRVQTYKCRTRAANDFLKKPCKNRYLTDIQLVLNGYSGA
jgi:hypothetical protein